MRSWSSSELALRSSIQGPKEKSSLSSLLAARTGQLMDALEVADFDVFVATSPANVMYATGEGPSTWADRYSSLAEAMAVALRELAGTPGRIGLDTAGLGPNEEPVR